jgi:hypothetical protein
VQRGALLGALLGHDERAAIEAEAGQERLAGGDLGVGLQPRRTRGEPLEATEAHQVEHEEELALELDHDALGEALHTGDAAALRVAPGGQRGAQEERRAELDLVEHVASDEALQALDVDGDVGQLGHRESGR